MRTKLRGPCVVGLDFSSHNIDMVALDEETDEATWQRIPLQGKTAWDRLLDWREHEYVSADWETCYLAAIEFPQPDQQRVLARMMGAIVARIPGRVPVWQFQPAEWRRGCGMAGNASKQDAADFAVARWSNRDRVFLPQDALDAYCIAWAARELNRQTLTRAA